ncbi:hypothetical protein Tco_1322878 [Tanacetum coccineum]
MEQVQFLLNKAMEEATLGNYQTALLLANQAKLEGREDARLIKCLNILNKNLTVVATMAYDAAWVGSSILLSSSKSRHDYDKRLLEAESGPPKTAGPSGRPKKTVGPSGRPKKTVGPSARPKKTTRRSSRNQATYRHSLATFSFGSRPSLFVPYSSAPRP